MSETMQSAAIPEDVRAFARERGVEMYLPAVLEAARRAFPGAVVGIELEPNPDPESEGACQLLITARGARLDVDQSLAAGDEYHRALFAIVPATHAWVYSLRVELAQ